MTSTNTVVANAMAARTARNGVEVEISPGYAARVQHAMRDAARVVSGVRMTSTNTLECRDEDAADDVIDILKQAGLPAGEVWTNARRAANATYKLSSTEAKVGDKVRVSGALGTYVVTKVDGEWIEIKDADDGTQHGHVQARFATPVKNAKRVARNANKIEKRFGDVEVLAYDDGGLGVRYVIDLGGFDRISNAVSWDDAGRKCAADARSMASLLEKKAQLVKQAASWLEQNAK